MRRELADGQGITFPLVDLEAHIAPGSRIEGEALLQPAAPRAAPTFAPVSPPTLAPTGKPPTGTIRHTTP
jgi:hypothetical protein